MCLVGFGEKWTLTYDRHTLDGYISYWGCLLITINKKFNEYYFIDRYKYKEL